MTQQNAASSDIVLEKDSVVETGTAIINDAQSGGINEKRKRDESHESDNGIAPPAKRQKTDAQNDASKFFADKYKGALLHTHFSGTVKTSSLLDFITTDPRCAGKIALFKERRNWNLAWVSENCPYEPISQEKLREQLPMLREAIKDAWDADFHVNFKVLGDLLFYLVKNEDFYSYYVELIRREMHEQHIEHIELRLKLGSLFKYNALKKVQFSSIQDEMDRLLEQQDLFKKDGLSMVIIAQSSKHAQESKVFEHFLTILKLLRDHPKYRALVKGFDLVGHEMEGKALSAFSQKLQSLNNLIKVWKLDIPFLFHAGEDFKILKKSLDNVDCALKFGSKRIGHGIYAFKRKHLVEALNKRGFVLEFCPYSMSFFGHLEEDTVEQFRRSQLKYCINSDDANKIRDADMNTNIEFLLEHGFTHDEIIESIRVGIEAALCDEDVRERMMNRWREEYQTEVPKRE